MANTSKIGVIGGTGFSEVARDPETVETDYGPVKVYRLELGGKEVAFVPRHRELEVPHLVNYRANIYALSSVGVDTVFAVSAAGRLGRHVLPGHLVAVDDVDHEGLGGRVMTYAEPGLLLHASMDHPFSDGLRRLLIDACRANRLKIQDIYKDSPHLAVGFHGRGTYFNVDGPQFSTPAKEDRLRRTVKNPTLIGQTLVPEVQLAREMQMAYGALGMCVDHSNFPGAESVKHADGVMVAVQKTAEAARLVLDYAIRHVSDNFHDPVAHEALRHALHPAQVNLEQLILGGRPKLAAIIAQRLGLEMPRIDGAGR